MTAASASHDHGNSENAMAAGTKRIRTIKKFVSGRSLNRSLALDAFMARKHSMPVEQPFFDPFLHHLAVRAVFFL